MISVFVERYYVEYAVCSYVIIARWTQLKKVQNCLCVFAPSTARINGGGFASLNCLTDVPVWARGASNN